MILVYMMLAGGAGAMVRFMVDGAIRVRVWWVLPVGTWAVNLIGSLALGALVGWGTHDGTAQSWVLVLGTGFLGGFTTFSTASFETVRLVQERHFWHALANSVGMAVACVAAAAVGFWGLS